MSKIFISHSSQDNAKALAVAQWLEQNGWNQEYFLDITPSRGLSPGERWQEALKTAADRCEAVLFLISPAWRDSKWCVTEFQLAKLLGKKVFGIVIESTPLDSLPREMTTEWQLCDLAAGAERLSFHVHRDQIVSPTDISLAREGLAALNQGLQKAGLGATSFSWPPPNDPKRDPYRGLKALEAEDAAIFFGRDAAIVRGLDKLRLMREQGVERLFVILGASGAGKSSYLRAGLWPRLERDDRHFWPLPAIRPDRSVITGPTGLVASLEAAFKRVSQQRNAGDLCEALEQPGGLDRLLMELQALAQKRFVADAEPPTIVLSIDQGEELFNTDGRDEADRFFSILGESLSQTSNDEQTAKATRTRLLGIIAIRSDSYERLQTAQALAAVKHNLFDLKPIAREEFRAVIMEPAKLVPTGLKIDPHLTEQLLKDSEGVDALPLLAFTLERLYLKYGKDGDLTLNEYMEKLGGIHGSIEKAVNDALPSEGKERDHLLRQAFIPWLAGVDPQTGLAKRRVARWDELPAEAHPLMHRLVEARLLTKDRRIVDSEQSAVNVVEVAHEALLRQWPSLRTWLDQDADLLKATETVRRAAKEWDKHERGDEWLDHRGDRLKAAENLRQRPDLWELLSQQGRDYIVKCRVKENQARAEREAQLKQIEAEQQKVAEAQNRTARFQKRSMALLTAIAMIVVLAGAWIWIQTKTVERQTSLLLASEAKNASDKGLYDRALRFAVVASRGTWLVNHIPEAEAELSRAAHASAQLSRYGGHEDSVSAAAFSPDGKQVVTASDDKTARLWDVHWITQYHGQDLIDAVCQKKLNGARNLTERDIQVSPILSGREGEDVCSPPSFLSRIASSLGVDTQPTSGTEPQKR